MSERKGKSIVRRRTESSQETSEAIQLTIDEARDYVYSYKQSEGLRDRTLDGYVRMSNYLRDWMAEHRPDIVYIHEVTSGVIRDYINYLQFDHYNQNKKEYGLSPVTINIRIRNMRASFTVLHGDNIIDKNPMALVKQLKTDEDSFIPLTDNEVKRLLKVPDKNEYAQFRDLVCLNLILDTGVRCSEMFDIKMENVDFKTRSIYLTGEITKNRKPRILPLSNEVMRLLLELITEVKFNWGTEYVFVSNFGGKYRPASFTRRVHIYKHKAGITKRVTPHMLRHQFCRDYILNGGDVFTLQRIAGHSDIATTRKYIQFTNDDIRGKHAKFSPMTVRHRRSGR